MVCKYFLPSTLSIVAFLSRSFWFDALLFVWFWFVACAFGLMTEKSWPRTNVQKLRCLFSSTSPVVLGLTFKSLIHCDLTFFHFHWVRMMQQEHWTHVSASESGKLWRPLALRRFLISARWRWDHPFISELLLLYGTAEVLKACMQAQKGAWLHGSLWGKSLTTQRRSERQE